jgi:aminoglycoside phosphotransferase (APT) family kinase protein
VLEDLSATHVQPPWPVPPEDAQCEAAVDALAALHAATWDHPGLTVEFGSPPSRERRAEQTRHTTDRTERFVASLGDRLSPTRRRNYAQVVDALPRLWEWWDRPRRRALVHGDAHAWNLLFPRTGGIEEAAQPGEWAIDSGVYLIDWQNWQIGPPTFDLATFMVLDWYPERRARLETPLLRRYHARLLALGVPDYAWDELWRDYRFAAANTLFTPAWRWDNGTEAQYWWPHLERCLAAFEDLDCASLLAL